MRKKPVNECYLCLRIEPKDVAIWAHNIWSAEPDFARHVVRETLKLVREIYQKNPTLLCGRTTRTIVGTLFYLLGLKHEEYRKSQTEIADALNIKEVTIRRNYELLTPYVFPERREHRRHLKHLYT